MLPLTVAAGAARTVPEWIHGAAIIVEVLAVVIIRTFLSWPLLVELEGHLPWQRTRDHAAQ